MFMKVEKLLFLWLLCRNILVVGSVDYLVMVFILIVWVCLLLSLVVLNLFYGMLWFMF